MRRTTLAITLLSLAAPACLRAQIPRTPVATAVSLESRLAGAGRIVLPRTPALRAPAMLPFARRRSSKSWYRRGGRKA